MHSGGVLEGSEEEGGGEVTVRGECGALLSCVWGKKFLHTAPHLRVVDVATWSGGYSLTKHTCASHISSQHLTKTHKHKKNYHVTSQSLFPRSVFWGTSPPITPLHPLHFMPPGTFSAGQTRQDRQTLPSPHSPASSQVPHRGVETRPGGE